MKTATATRFTPSVIAVVVDTESGTISRGKASFESRFPRPTSEYIISVLASAKNVQSTIPSSR